MSARTTLVQYLRDIVETDAEVVEVEDNTDTLGKITIVVKQRRMLRLAQAPAGALRVEFVLSVTHPGIDPATSEPGLDDFVPSLLSQLNERPGFGWNDATKVADEQNLGYDIDCFLIVGPDNKTARKGTEKKEASDGRD